MLKISILDNLLGRNNDPEVVPMIEATSTGQKIHMKETALESAMTYITDRASLAILNTKDEKLYYRWNVKPNPYQNAQEFKRELLRKMLIDGECLVVQETNNDHYLHVADSFLEERNGLNDVTYTDIVVKAEDFGDIKSEDAYHFRYKNDRVKKWTDMLDNNYADLFIRLIEVQKLQSQLRIYPKFRTTTGKRKEQQTKFKKFLTDFQEAVNTQQVVVAPTQDDYDITENKTAYKGFNVDEVKKMENIYLADVFELYGITSALLDGELADISQHRSDFVRFVHSIMQIISTEINAKYFGDSSSGYKTDKVKVVLFYLEYNSIFSASKEFEKMIGSGVTLNEILEEQGKEPIDDPVGDKRFLTKNIGSIEHTDEERG